MSSGDRRARFAGAAVAVVGHSHPLLWSCVRHLAAEDGEVLAVVAAPCDELPAEAASARDVLRADVTDDAALQDAAATLSQGWPPLRALVNCHTDLDVGRIEDASTAAWLRVLTSNLIGPLVSTLAFLPALKSSGSSAIVHLGSVDGIQGNPAVPSYSVSKGGLVPLTHVMAEEFAPYGIRVNCVARAAIADGPAPPSPALLAETPLGWAAEPAEVAAAVLFLACSEASYITGSVLVVDGGRTGITPGTRTRSTEG